MRPGSRFLHLLVRLFTANTRVKKPTARSHFLEHFYLHKDCVSRRIFCYILCNKKGFILLLDTNTWHLAYFYIGGAQLKNQFSPRLHSRLKFSQVALMGMSYDPAKGQVSKGPSWLPMISGKFHFFYRAGYLYELAGCDPAGRKISEKIRKNYVNTGPNKKGVIAPE